MFATIPDLRVYDHSHGDFHINSGGTSTFPQGPSPSTAGTDPLRVAQRPLRPPGYTTVGTPGPVCAPTPNHGWTGSTVVPNLLRAWMSSGDDRVGVRQDEGEHGPL